MQSHVRYKDMVSIYLDGATDPYMFEIWRYCTDKTPASEAEQCIDVDGLSRNKNRF